MRRLVYTLTLVLLPLLATGQVVVLQGVVSDRVSGARLEFASVGVLGTSVGTTTDAGGHYRLSLTAGDSVTVRFSFTGYEPQEYRLLPKSNRTLDVRLQPSTRMLDAVEISDEKTRHSSFTHLGTDELEYTVGPAGGVESLLKTLPDVNSNNELSSQYSVRGGSFDENLVYINGVEIFRPMLIRNGQQEGMSIINADMVDYVLFSPGGFDATYGDRLSSVLDITYARPREFSAKLSVSLLGGTATVMDSPTDKLSYAASFRSHSNSYILRSMDTRGSYTTRYNDLQLTLGYRASDRTNFSVLGIWTNNVYGLVPESQVTSFGSLAQYMQLEVYFDGKEQDRYNTLLGAFTLDHRINDNWKLKASLSAQKIVESERYDVQSQYFLYEVGAGEVVGETERFDRGVGTFLEHASNRLSTAIYAADIRLTRYARLGQWDLGLKLQHERVNDHLREWRWVDSAGYSVPQTPPLPGDSTSMPQSPLLQGYSNAENSLYTSRAMFFAQREINFYIHHKADIKVLVGARGNVYTRHDVPQMHTLVSPRASISIKPYWEKDILFRLAGGVYSQPPFYREYRRSDGVLVDNLAAQKTYQAIASADWSMRIWDKPFKLTADIYYKYIDDLVPYTIDNLRLRYMPDMSAVGYTTGISLRLNGEIVEGLESWASLSLMQSRQDIEGDDLGWLRRPADQLLSFKMFFQDNVPQIPWWKMSLSLIYGSPLPIDIPGMEFSATQLEIPSYFRVDWGNTLQLARFGSLGKMRLFKHIKDIQVGLEVFNLFNYNNVVSYLWVSDYEGHPFRVPNYLTSRRINLKLSVLF